jgi:hypothetical protein
LFIYLPILYPSRDVFLSEELRTKLLVAAIEVAEYNHALNAEQACRHWRWVFQTYTHWHAIVYILIEISRRPWSPLVDRAWAALHSVWLIPSQSHMGKHLRIWFPLRKLMSRAKKHRETEIERLHGDAGAVAQLESEYRTMELPSSPTVPSSSGSDATELGSAELCLKRWRQLVTSPMVSTTQISGYTMPGVSTSMPSSAPGLSDANSNALSAFGPAYIGTAAQADQKLLGANFQTTQQSMTASPTGSQDNLSWLWSDNYFANTTDETLDVNMDFDADIDWYNWVESAKGAEINGPGN